MAFTVSLGMTNRLLVAGAMALCACAHITTSSAAEPRWWKGNLHTHSLWSDGDDFPEMITAWYKDQGYHFLAISDHNVLQLSERWTLIGTNKLRREALEKYRNRYGTNWVEWRSAGTNVEVRLKPLNEYRALFDEAGKFLLIASEELTDKFEKYPVHLNASNIRDYIPPQGGNSVREVMQNNVDAVLVQSRMTGQKMLPHLNHPNFGWGVTAEDLAAIRGEHFFEVYNGHPHVYNDGDTTHASAERIWDIALALRLASSDREPLYGLAVDDAHNYHRQGIGESNAGRGWIMVRSRYLTPEFLLRALERGDFYSSSGVVLQELTVADDSLKIEVQAETGVEYRTEFIGLRRGFSIISEPTKNQEGKDLPVTRRYHPSVGEILGKVTGPSASYKFKGDELYVRARITSSKEKMNGYRANEREMAWTQPIFRGEN
jgi:hypothetical protein